MARLSVVIPCHNYGRFLGEALESLDRQTRRPDEILVCDDGSSDDSWRIIEHAAASRPNLVVIRHEHARGLIATFNELVQRSTGTIIFPLSADDRYGPTYLQRMEEDLDQYGWDFGYADHQLFGAEDSFFVAPEFDDVRLVRENYIAGTSAFRRSLFDRIGGYSDAFDRIGFEDYEFWMRAIELGATGGKVHGCHFEWRRHAAGSRNTASRRRRVEMRLRLLWARPRFFFHPRSARAVGRAWRRRATWTAAPR